MASFYSIYHGKEGLIEIANKVNHLTSLLKKNLEVNGIDCLEDDFFDTLIIRSGQQTKEIHKRSLSKNINLRRIDEEHIGISLDETTSMKDIENILELSLIHI